VFRLAITNLPADSVWRRAARPSVWITKQTTAAVGAWEVFGQAEVPLAILFPRLAGLRADRAEDTGDAVVISASCQAASACGPRCGQQSSRVRGGYSRVVADGAAGGRPVLIALAVRRFRCQQPSCPQVAFAEQAAGFTSRYRRRSVPLMAMLAGFGLELAGPTAPCPPPMKRSDRCFKFAWCWWW
jgi:hypothetical protein